MDNNLIQVYVELDDANRITAINSSIFLTDVAEWTQIDKGVGDKYAHAQGNYFGKPLVDNSGCYNYKLIDGKRVERTSAEKQADVIEQPAPAPSTTEQQLAAMALTQAEQASTIETLQQSNAALMLRLAELGGNA